MVDQVVFTAFQRFDQDGSGYITGEELTRVLQSLEPDDSRHLLNIFWAILASFCHQNCTKGGFFWAASVQDWDNERVAELLATADSSGDGKLQIGEFIKWIFAEDPKAIGLGFLDLPRH